MSELLCRRDRDGVNDEVFVRKVLGFPNGNGLLDCQHLNGTKTQGPRNRWFDIRIEGQISATSPRLQLNTK